MNSPKVHWPDVAMRIISSVTALLLIGGALYIIAIDRSEHVDSLLAAALSVLGALGILMPSPFRSGSGPTVPPTLIMLLATVCASYAIASSSAGCGASRQHQHDVLNRITDVADPTYALVVETCDVLRDGIVARQGTTWDEDTAAMDRVDAVCDPIVTGMETLRGTQLTVRAAIDAGAEGAILEGLSAALRLWRDLQALVPQLRDLGRGARDSPRSSAQDGGVS